ncbi:hypothetical protein I7I53_00905 [Histoplasma capsulatum var. duboisii H88]|uniref:Uncharacterized protein n=1 Tax=Ajellomyces capsulatus (strain H88) TaxID=544711 RepID=A0A8A1LLV4_AJEC8|nr:hypothetical protein I7I53_00905 [Histoplasma capsulatum var. duboisii H88]
MREILNECNATLVLLHADIAIYGRAGWPEVMPRAVLKNRSVSLWYCGAVLKMLKAWIRQKQRQTIHLKGHLAMPGGYMPIRRTYN